MNDSKLDGCKWKFLNNPGNYAKGSDLIVKPLRRQFRTAKEILERFQDGHGVLLADDVGLGKTTVGALVAWIVACQKKRVRIYAPNEVLRRRWAEELERHVPMLLQLGAKSDYIKQGAVTRLNAGRIQIATHHTLVKSHGNNEQRSACDLIIIDEAHRAKGDGSAFNEALKNLHARATWKLILTATPLSIRIEELKQLLTFAGADRDKLSKVTDYANELKRLYSLGDGYDATAESKRLVSAAKSAVEELRPYLIRHSIDDLLVLERKHFGEVDKKPWDIQTTPATQDDIALLLRMDRILQLKPERMGERRNDPRFHIGWQHVDVELKRAEERAGDSDPILRKHIDKAKNALATKCTKPHPKVAAVRDAIRTVINGGEKVLVFCHHRATASELLCELEGSLTQMIASRNGPEEKVWRAAWESLLHHKDLPYHEDPLVKPIIDWLCSPGLRAQISDWLGKPEETEKKLKNQLEKTLPRKAKSGVPTIAKSAQDLTRVLLDPQSKSTRALLKGIANRTQAFAGKESHFPGLLDEGLRVMGSWDQDAPSDQPKTLYTGKPDIVIAIFNSPFGPDVLITTDRLSEGVDLHRCCRHLIHYELDSSPVRTLQRNGRVRRVGSWAALTGQPIQYAYPIFGGTRDEKAVGVMRQRINAFGLLLGGVPSLDDDESSRDQAFVETVLLKASKELGKLNRKLCV